MCYYRLLRTIAGITHFASIECRLCTSDDGHASVTCQLDPSDGLVNSDWVQFAINGASLAMEHLGESSRGIEIVKVLGTVIDTRSDAVFVASYLAALRCLGVHDDDLPQPIFNERWSV